MNLSTHELLLIIISNPLYLVGISLFFIFLGFSISGLFKNNYSNIRNTEDIIEDYTNEVVDNITSSSSFKEKPLHLKSNLEFTTAAPRVLIAEDNLVNAKILIKLLKKFGITDYVHVEDGLKAFITRKNDDNFSIILMDINMPNMTGDEATQEIIKWENSNNKVHIPIVAVTANALIGDREKYLEEGMDEYTTKPLKINEIQSIISKLTGYKIEI